MIQCRRQRFDAVERKNAVTWLEADGGTVVGRNADGTSGVCAQRHLANTHSD
jgi:hypothetical protein